MTDKYDVITVGAGHAGSEASCRRNTGSKTLLITSDMTAVAKMSCNPATGDRKRGKSSAGNRTALGGYTGYGNPKKQAGPKFPNGFNHGRKGPGNWWSPKEAKGPTRIGRGFLLRKLGEQKLGSEKKPPNLGFYGQD